MNNKKNHIESARQIIISLGLHVRNTMSVPLSVYWLC